jgi:uridylate kinase
MVIKATRVDGVFDRDPEVDPAAIRYDRITFDFAIRQGLRVMDSTAFTICKDHQLPIRVLDLGIEGNLARAVNGESVGTLVSAQGDEE